MTTPGNPYEAPAAPAETGGRSRAGCRAWTRLAVQRALLHGVVPLLAGFVAEASGVAPFWLAWGLGMLPWLPGTILYVVHFLAPVRDERPVALSSGMVMDRGRFAQVIRVSAGDRVLLGLLLLGGAAVFARLGGPIAVLVPFFVLFAAWAWWFAWQYTRVGDALIAYVTEDHREVLRLLGPVIRHPWLNQPFVHAARLQVANARLRLGDVQGALDVLRQVPSNRLPQAHYARAQILAGQGRTEQARRALRGRPTRNLGERLGRATAEALIALEDDRTETALERTARFEELARDLPTTVGGGLALLRAAALARAGRLDQARRVLRHSPVQPEDRPWMAEAFPGWWEALEAISPPGPPRGPA